jgi:hypothetical protein
MEAVKPKDLGYFRRPNHLNMLVHSTTLYLSLLACFVIGCSPASSEGIARSKAEAKLLESMNDPDSYEYVSFELWDSLSYMDIAEHRRELIDGAISAERQNIQGMEDLNLKVPGKYSEQDIEEVRASLAEDIAKRARVDAKVDSLGTKAQNAASYTFYFKYRGNSALGAKVLSECYVQTTPAPEYDVLNIAQTVRDLKGNPFQ